MKKKYIVYSIWYIGIFLFLSTFYHLPPTIDAQSSGCTSNSLAQGLISTGGSVSGFGNNIPGNTNPVCIKDTASANFLFRTPSYAELKSVYYTQSSSKNPSGPSSSATISSINNNLVDNYTANVTIAGLNYTGTSVIFIDQSLVISGNICSGGACGVGANTDSLIIVVGGDINIASTVTQIDAVLISTGYIYTASSSGSCSVSNVPVNTALTVNGSLVSLNSNTPIRFCRSLNNGNATPAEIINQQPKYLVILRNLFSQSLQIWSEYAGNVADITTPTGNTRLYFDTSPADSNSTVTLTATGTSTCSTGITDPPTSGGGYASCSTLAAFACASGNPKDANACWGQWRCTTSTVAADTNYTATFDSTQNNFCTSNVGYTVLSGPKRVFVTNNTYLPAAIGGLAGADNICQTRANAVSLGGSWKAWLSSSTVSAASRLTHSNKPYRMLNNVNIANDWNSLVTNQVLLTPLNRNENNVAIAASNTWTGTNANGTIAVGTNFCSDWTVTSASPANVVLGLTSNATSWWTRITNVTQACNIARRLYCFEQ